MKELPSVCVIIPCRNEEKNIGRCLDSIISNDYPHDKLEILVVDGASEDSTRQVTEDYARRYPFIKLLANPKRIFASALNIGIRYSKGSFVAIVGAHTIYSKEYISQCVKFLVDYDADNVGGRLIILPGDETLFAKAVAVVLSHPFGSGNSTYKTGSSREPRLVDTVFGGFYRRRVFETVGLFKESLKRSSDIDFNIRLRKAGGKILLVPEIVAQYYTHSGFRTFCRRNFYDGFWPIYALARGGGMYKWRHYIPPLFVLALVGSALLGLASAVFLWLAAGIFVAYALANAASTVHIALTKGMGRYLLLVPVVFFLRHTARGIGSLAGFGKVLTSRGFWHSLPRVQRQRSA